MGADKSAQNTPNAPKLSAQAQKFVILMKKDFIGRPQSVCEPASLDTQISFSFDEIMTVFVRKKGYGVDLTTWLAISAILNQLSTKWVEINFVGVIFAFFTSADQI